MEQDRKDEQATELKTRISSSDFLKDIERRLSEDKGLTIFVVSSNISDAIDFIAGVNLRTGNRYNSRLVSITTEEYERRKRKEFVDMQRYEVHLDNIVLLA